MKQIILDLPKLHPSQQQVKTSFRRFNVLDCGRRWGKTILGEDMAIHPALNGDPVGWFSPSYKMLLEVWRDLASKLYPVIRRINVQERRIELLTDGLIEMWSLDNPDVARGRKYKRIIVDEAAMVARLLEAWNSVLRPTLIDMEGDAFFLSTPKGRNGFWQLYQYGIDDTQTDWAAWQLPTTENPHIPLSEIEDIRQTSPERIFAQEIMAQFLDDAGGVFRRVLDAVTAKQQETPSLDTQYVVGVDWAKHNDFTVFALVDIHNRSLAYLDRFNQIDYSLQVGRLKALYDKFRPISIVAERNSMGEPLIEQLQQENLPVQPFLTTNASKAQIIDGLALGFERGEIKILPDQTLISELQAYEMERLPSGLLRYSAPDGMHDDTVMALALAWYGATAGVLTGQLFY